MPSRSFLTPRTSPIRTMLSADKVIAPAAAKALEQKRRMTEIELTKPQEAQCCLSEPAQGNLFHKISHANILQGILTDAGRPCNSPARRSTTARPAFRS